jgi:hypothetical protein
MTKPKELKKGQASVETSLINLKFFVNIPFPDAGLLYEPPILSLFRASEPPSYQLFFSPVGPALLLHLGPRLERGSWAASGSKTQGGGLLFVGGGERSLKGATENQSAQTKITNTGRVGCRK